MTDSSAAPATGAWPDGVRKVTFAPAHRDGVKALWEACGMVRPWNDPDKDIDRKLTDTQGRFWLLLSGETVVGSVMVGYDGHRGSIYYLAIDPACQGQGLGRRLMADCEAFLLDLGCPKVNLMVRRGNEKVVGFYEDQGFAEDQAMVLGKRLIPDI